MLKSLLIKNYLLIEHLEINISDGLSVLTGETGAGKSIIIDALGLILGNRLSSGLNIDNNNKCVVEARFDISGNEDTFALLKENDLDDGNNLILRREILKAGKSRAFANDTPVNLQQLEEISSKLIDLHNQFANEAISHADFRLNVVDSVANTGLLAENYNNDYRDFMSLKKELENKKTHYNNISKEIDYFEFQLSVIADTGVKNNSEFEELETEAYMLSHAEELKTSVYSCIELMNKGENDLISLTKKSIYILSKAVKAYDKLKPVSERLEILLVELKDIASELDLINSKLEVNPERLVLVTEQLDRINHLFNKFRVNSMDELIILEKEFKTKIEEANRLETDINRLSDDLNKMVKNIKRQALELSSLRLASFDSISTKVEEMLQLLGMNNARFKLINNTSVEPGRYGYDNIEFLFSANKNMALEPVSQSASGGELSRLMLCLKSLISDKDAIPTLIFDEIDTGVSGEIADKMGKIMQKLAQGRQIISITHLPQVAARGKQHYKVLKTDVDDRIITNLKLLSPNERIEELASMLSGSEVTDAARNNAKHLLKNAVL